MRPFVIKLPPKIAFPGALALTSKHLYVADDNGVLWPTGIPVLPRTRPQLDGYH
jgi:hypothetical protein